MDKTRLDQYLEQLKSKDKNIRIHALNAIGNLGDQALDVILVIVSVINEDDMRSVRDAAFDALRKIRERTENYVQIVLEMVRKGIEDLRV